MRAETELQLRELEDMAQAIAKRVGPMFDQAGVCFALLGFTVGEKGWSTWVSNAERPCMIKALREMADVLETGGDMPAANQFPGDIPEA